MRHGSPTGSKRSSHAQVDWPPVPEPPLSTSQGSPLERWLEQSALVAQGEPAIDRDLREKVKSLLRGWQEEINEIKFFKSVQVPLTTEQETQTLAMNHIVDNSRIYYRNILDKYPKIPPFLAERLAEASSRNTQRLSSEVGGEAKATRATESKEEFCIPKLIFQQGFTQPGFQPNFLREAAAELCPPQFLPETASKYMGDEPLEAKSNFMAYQMGEFHESGSYWLGDSYRPPSPEARSRSSSMNSSLKGPAAFDPREQDPGFQKESSELRSLRRINHTHSKKKPTYPLPTPPIELGTRSSFQCDICFRVVYAQNMLQWK